jgi:hypothetical protein
MSLSDEAGPYFSRSQPTRLQSFLVKAAAAAKLSAAVCLRGFAPVNHGSHSAIGTPFALLLVRGEHVSKQTSAEATNGKLVST